MQQRTRRRLSWITVAFLVLAVARLVLHVIGWAS